MSQPFGSSYAASYDALYQDKDYPGECDLIESLLQKYSTKPVREILDLGCGTGNHALPLAERGYEIVGVDRAPDMIARAQQKTDNSKYRYAPIWQCADIRSLQLNRTFDAVLIMFAVLGYQHSNEDVLATLASARRHLRPGGVLIFDVWYGPAVLTEKPSQRIKVISTDRGKILRVSSGTLDSRSQICGVNYLLWNLESDRLISYTEESHLMRYFFAPELELFLKSTGFRAIRTGAFPEFQKDPDETTWNILQVATAAED